MPKSRPSAKAKSPTQVIIDLPGIDPDARVEDLTVAQFVQLMHAVCKEALRTQIPDAETIDTVLGQIRRQLAADERPLAAFSDTVRNAQTAILDQMPEIMSQAAAATRRKSASGSGA